METISLHPEDIKASIRKRHGSLAAFERTRGLPQESVRDVLRGKSVSQTAIAIAEELGVTVQKLFPGRFQSLIRDNSRAGDMPHRQNGGAK